MNDSTLVMINGDASYDVPWEFNKNKHISKLVPSTASQHHTSKKPSQIGANDKQSAQISNTKTPCTCHLIANSNGSSKADLHNHHNVVANNVKSSTPPCGVKARELKNKLVAQTTTTPGTEHQQPAGHKSENYIVWRYRGPDTDGRPSSDYDTPWDMMCRQQQDCNKMLIRQDHRMTATTILQGSKNEDQQSADSGVYDEPWDRTQPLRRSKANGVVPKQRFPFLSNGKAAAASAAESGGVATAESGSVEDPGSISSCNPSPCTSSRSTSSRESTGGGDGRIAAQTRGAVRTVAMETVFYAGAGKQLVASSAAAENHRMQEVRDRLIQHLCNSSTLDINKLNRPTSEPPKPAVRRSKVKLSPDDVMFSPPPKETNNVANPNIIGSAKSDLIMCSNIKLDSNVVKSSVKDKEFRVNPGETDSKFVTTNAEVYDIPWEFTSGSSKLQEQIKRRLDQRSVEKDEKDESELQQQQRNDNGAGAGACKKPTNFSRQNLRLNFGCAGLNPVSEKVDANLSLDQQPWYHGNITRAEAEQRLRGCKEGSYLVRVCESAQSQKHEEYALSLKSAKGFMHMKIQLNGDKKWILGYFSNPFDSISKMIRYYSVNKLPIKGAEHMCLLQPIADQVL